MHGDLAIDEAAKLASEVLCQLIDRVAHLSLCHPTTDDVPIEVDLRLRPGGARDPRVLLLCQHDMGIENWCLDESIKRGELPADVLLESRRDITAPCHPHVHGRFPLGRVTWTIERPSCIDVSLARARWLRISSSHGCVTAVGILRFPRVEIVYGAPLRCGGEPEASRRRHQEMADTIYEEIRRLCRPVA